MSTERVKLCKIVGGSKLFGTDTPQSDNDFIGIFIPSKQELLGLENPPSEWSLSSKVSGQQRNTKDDTDYTLFSVRQFIEEAAAGQSQKLEMLFAPRDKWLETSPAWELLVENRHLFLSRRGVAPFLGFAIKQAYKATVKGSHLTLIRKTIKAAKEDRARVKGPLRNHLTFSHVDEDGNPKPGSCNYYGVVLDFIRNDQNFPMVKVGGREYDIGKPAVEFIKSLEHLEGRYGTRVDAAASKGYDHKSVLHCMRQLFEAEEFLKTGHITLPRPKEEIEFLMTIRAEQWPTMHPDDFLKHVLKEKDRIEQEVMPKSQLPEKPNRGELSKICSYIHGLNM